MNPWPLVGGVAMSVRSESQIIRPVNAVPGDVIILTKPLGTQVAVNFFQWRKKPERWQRVENIATVEDAEEAVPHGDRVHDATQPQRCASHAQVRRALGDGRHGLWHLAPRPQPGQ
ncbi:hypothetical protein PINS_up020678, partial [Pythium insidiosum]